MKTCEIKCVNNTNWRLVVRREQSGSGMGEKASEEWVAVLLEING